MFRKMKKCLGRKTDNLSFALKSRDGLLSVSDKLDLNDFYRIGFIAAKIRKKDGLLD